MTGSPDIRTLQSVPESRRSPIADHDEPQHAKPPASVRDLVERALDSVGSASINDIHEWGQYHNSRLALHVLARLAFPEEPAALLDVRHRERRLEKAALNLEAVCALAASIGLKARTHMERDRALALFDLAYRRLGGDMPAEHQALHVTTAYLDGRKLLFKQLLKAYGAIPESVADSFACQDAHPRHGGSVKAYMRRFKEFTGWPELESPEPGASLCFDSLRTAPLEPIARGPKISVVMTCFRPDEALLTAVRSIVAQTWQNWELLLVDDGSGPDYEDVLLAAAALDPRVKLLIQPENAGTYQARNRAMAVAQGKYITGLDSDDWAHPTRLATQVRPMIANSNLVMVETRCIALAEDLSLMIDPQVALIAARSTPIMIRAEEVLRKVGFYDEVRKTADSEYRFRIRAAFGKDAFVRLSGGPLTAVRHNDSTLSAGEVSRHWMSAARFAYYSGFARWHRAIDREQASPFLASMPRPRPFPITQDLTRSNAENRAIEYGRIYAADWSELGPRRRSMLDDAGKRADEGMAVGLLHSPDWSGVIGDRALVDRAVLRAAAEHGLDFIEPEPRHTAPVIVPSEAYGELLRFEHPDIPAERIRLLPGPGTGALGDRERGARASVGGSAHDAAGDAGPTAPVRGAAANHSFLDAAVEPAAIVQGAVVDRSGWAAADDSVSATTDGTAPGDAALAATAQAAAGGAASAATVQGAAAGGSGSAAAGQGSTARGLGRAARVESAAIVEGAVVDRSHRAAAVERDAIAQGASAGGSDSAVPEQGLASSDAASAANAQGAAGGSASAATVEPTVTAQSVARDGSGAPGAETALAQGIATDGSVLAAPAQGAAANGSGSAAAADAAATSHGAASASAATVESAVTGQGLAAGSASAAGTAQGATVGDSGSGSGGSASDRSGSAVTSQAAASGSASAVSASGATGTVPGQGLAASDSAPASSTQGAASGPASAASALGANGGSGAAATAPAQTSAASDSASPSASTEQGTPSGGSGSAAAASTTTAPAQGNSEDHTAAAAPASAADRSAADSALDAAQPAAPRIFRRNDLLVIGGGLASVLAALLLTAAFDSASLAWVAGASAAVWVGSFVALTAWRAAVRPAPGRSAIAEMPQGPCEEPIRLRQIPGAAARRPIWTAASAAPLIPVLGIAAPQPWLPVGIAITVLCVLAACIDLGLNRAYERVRAEAAEPEATTETGVALTAQKRQMIKRWETRLHYGWSVSATAKLEGIAAGAEKGYRETQIQALAALCGYRAARARNHRPARTLHVDIVIVSTLNLKGGTTSANEAEILAYRAAGLTVALVHHPVKERAMGRPIDPKIRALIDDELVYEVRPQDTVHCDLAIMRFPVAFENLMEDRPRIEAARTVLLVNQTPFEEYGPVGGYGTAWSIRDVHRNVTDWVGHHTWYAIGPAVRDVLRAHHAEEMEDIDLATDFWYETIDIAEWTPRERRVREDDEPIRLGRHSRDHVTKFPNMARRLLTAYPVAEDIEVHMLGGHEALHRILGKIPPGWTSHRFGTMSAVDFLGQVDVYAYFIDENLLEAFGRAPMEAMAAGVPCLLPPNFAELFGDGAIYCEPDEVEAQVRLLASDKAYYAERAAAGLRVVHERFSPDALLRRVNGLGVTAREPNRTIVPMSLGGAE
jgi:glycosyltransferase involved in cell wall biosynthesis